MLGHSLETFLSMRELLWSCSSPQKRSRQAELHCWTQVWYFPSMRSVTEGFEMASMMQLNLKFFSFQNWREGFFPKHAGTVSSPSPLTLHQIWSDSGVRVYLGPLLSDRLLNRRWKLMFQCCCSLLLPLYLSWRHVKPERRLWDTWAIGILSW